MKEAFRTGILVLKNKIETLKEEVKKLADEKEDRMQWIGQFIQYRGFETLSRELLLRLVEEIRVYDKNRIEIVFQFQSEYEDMCRYVSGVED